MGREPRIKREMVGEFWSIPVFECECCGGDMAEWVEHEGEYICPECAFLNGIIDDQEYVKKAYYFVGYKTARAVIYDGEILVAFDNEKFPFEKTDRDYRQSKEYRDWRMAVFQRDNFTCQVCGQVGGELNAHHIKTFKDHPKLRFELSNGITLCEKCHKEIHRRMRANGHKKGS